MQYNILISPLITLYENFWHQSRSYMCHIWPCMISKKFFQLQRKIKIMQFLISEIFCLILVWFLRKSYMVLVWVPRIHTNYIWPSIITKNHIWPSTKSKKVVWSLTRDNVFCEPNPPPPSSYTPELPRTERRSSVVGRLWEGIIICDLFTCYFVDVWRKY